MTATAMTMLMLSTAFSVTAFAAPVSSAPTTPASSDVTKSYLIAFNNNLPSDYQSIISDAGGRVVVALPELGGVEVQSNNPDFLNNLGHLGSIQAANEEFKISQGFEEADPSAANGQPVTDIPQPEDISSYWQYQWDIQKITNNGESYKIETGGVENPDKTITHKAVVGVIDTGIDEAHPDLKANFVGGRNMVPAGGWGGDTSETGDPSDVWDRQGHGTHVAGSIAGNGKIKGVGPDLGIRSYRVFPAEDSAATAWIANAIVAAANDHVDVINMSIGGFDAITKYQYAGSKYNDLADLLIWKRAIRYAVNHNVVVVDAAGNESLDLNNPTTITKYLNEMYGGPDLVYKGASISTPAQIPGTITVSSSNKWSTDQIAFYSNYGTRSIDVAAPGGDNGPIYAQTGDLNQRDFHYRALSTWPTYLAPYFTANLHGYALLHGTSMASPKVAGIAGVIRAAHPNMNPAQVAAQIAQTANDYGKPGTDQLFGAGEANIYNALTQK